MFNNDKNDISEASRDAALEAARAATPRVYKLAGLKGKNGKLRFAAFGCQGSANEAQAAVGKAIADFIETHPDKRPDFILLLGDNFYSDGVKSPRSNKFIKSFLKPYKTLIEEHGIKFFAIPGNHDYNMRKQAQFYSASKEGKELILSQVAYSYLGRVGLYADGIANLDDLPFWNMPSPYYALDADDTRIICLDSNTYIADYLIKHQPGQTAENNQALWLEAVTAEAKAEGRQCILAMHHPTYSPGKRAFKNDVNLYLKSEQRDELYACFPDLDPTKTPYNMYLKACFESQKLSYDLILHAHDHNQYYYNNGNIKQLGLGGGGEKLQVQGAFQYPEHLGCFRDKHGFGLIKTKLKNPEKIDFSVHSLKELPLFFSNKSVVPKQKPIDSDDVKLVVTAVKIALVVYFNFLERLQNKHGPLFLSKNFAHSYNEVKCAHEVSALIHAKKLDDYQTLLENLYALIKKTEPFLRAEASHALSRLVNEELSCQFGQETTLKSLVQATAEPKEKNTFKLKQL